MEKAFGKWILISLASDTATSWDEASNNDRRQPRETRGDQFILYSGNTQHYIASEIVSIAF